MAKPAVLAAKAAQAQAQTAADVAEALKILRRIDRKLNALPDTLKEQIAGDDTDEAAEPEPADASTDAEPEPEPTTERKGRR